MPIQNKPSVYMGHQFITRKIITALLDWLNKKIYVERYRDDGTIYRYIRVPTQYAQREYFMNMIRNSNIKGNQTDNQIDINRIIPRMSVIITSMTYDSERKIGKFQKVRAENYDGSAGTLEQVMAPVPYSLDIELAMITKTLDDNYQIIEQLIPYFVPNLSLDLNILPGFESESIPYVLESVTPDGNDEFGVTEERIFSSILNIRAKCNYYYIRKDHKAIKEIIANLHVGKDDTYRLFKRYELDADNPIPVTTIADREDEPITQTVTENIFSIFTEDGLTLITEHEETILQEY